MYHVLPIDNGANALLSTTTIDDNSSQRLGRPTMSWCALIKAWMDFEVHHEFKDVAKLGAKNRPECIQEWIWRRWSTSWKLPINGVSTFESNFMSWWPSLQPDWRLLADGSIDFSAVEGNWDKLQRPGLRGLHNVIVGLFYWALEVENENKGRAQWLIMVEDCQGVFTKKNMDITSKFFLRAQGRD